MIVPSLVGTDNIGTHGLMVVTHVHVIRVTSRALLLIVLKVSVLNQIHPLLDLVVLLAEVSF